jgi:hypothetical protein
MSIGSQLKEALSQKSDELKRELETDITSVSDNLESTAKKAVFIVGAIVAAALVIRLLAPKAKKVKVNAAGGGQELMVINEPENGIVTMIKGAIATFLLNLAKERIMNFLEELNARQAIAKEKEKE